MGIRKDRYLQLVADLENCSKHLEELRSERSNALIEGLRFDKLSKLSELESEVIALSDAVVAAKRLADAEAQDEVAQAKCKALLATENQITSTIERYAGLAHEADLAARDFVDHVLAMIDLGSKLHTLIIPHHPQANIPELDQMGMSLRLSERLLQTMAKLSPEHGLFGQIRWPAPQQPVIEVDWATEEKALLERVVQIVRKSIADRLQESGGAQASE